MSYTTISVGKYFHIDYLFIFDHFMRGKQGLYKFFNKKIYIGPELFIKLFLLFIIKIVFDICFYLQK
ncbi:hypothetical protein DB281_04665 (plasmid) [Borreliella garinii]|nr:hypothetical protein DB281_04665 [Borreliella garinii]